MKTLRRPEITRRVRRPHRRRGRWRLGADRRAGAACWRGAPPTSATCRPSHRARRTRASTDCRPAASLPKFSHVKPCVVGAAGDPSVMVMGDSHALMLTPIAEWSAKAEGKTAVVLGLTTCPPLQGVDVAYFSRSVCARSNDEILDWLETPSRIRSPARCWRRAGRSTTSRTRRPRDAGLAEPVLERCQGAQPRLFNDRRRRARRFHHGAGPEPARADRRAGAGAQASARELPAAGATDRAAAEVVRGQAKRRRATASRDMAGAAQRGGEIPERPADRSGGSAVRPRHLLAVRLPRPATMSTRTISACSAPRCCTGASSAISDGCMATGRRSDGDGRVTSP